MHWDGGNGGKDFSLGIKSYLCFDVQSEIVGNPGFFIQGAVKLASKIKLAVNQPVPFLGITDENALVAPAIGFHSSAYLTGLGADKVGDFNPVDINCVLLPYLAVFFIIADVTQSLPDAVRQVVQFNVARDFAAQDYMIVFYHNFYGVTYAGILFYTFVKQCT